MDLVLHSHPLPAVRWLSFPPYSYLPERVALIVVEAALHTHDGCTVELAEDQAPGMTRNRALREVRDSLVGEGDLVSQHVRQGPWNTQQICSQYLRNTFSGRLIFVQCKSSDNTLLVLHSAITITVPYESDRLGPGQVQSLPTRGAATSKKRSALCCQRSNASVKTFLRFTFLAGLCSNSENKRIPTRTHTSNS